MRAPPKIDLTKLNDLQDWLNDLWKLVELYSCKIQTISYVGNGATSHTITTNVIPKLVMVWRRPQDNVAGACSMWMRSDLSSNQAALKHMGPGGHQGINNNLIAIDESTPGFTVDDAGVNSHPNASGVTYHALVLG